MFKVCLECKCIVGTRNRTGLCKKDREKKWVLEHRSRSNEIKKRYVQLNPESRYQSLVRYREKNRVRVNAWAFLRYYLNKGEIEKPSICEVCLSEEAKHAHHPNINLPLLVVWVCNPCHKRAHGYNNQLHYAA